MFSFASTKNISAGEGGAVVTQRADLATRIAALPDHGRPPGTSSPHPHLGWNLRLSEFQAAVLRAQLTRVEHQTAAKERGATFLAAELSTIPGLAPVPPALDPRVTTHGRFSLAFTYAPEAFDDVPIDRFRAALRAEGIPVGRGTLIPCSDEPIYADHTNPDYTPARVIADTHARIACARLVLLGQAAGSGMLLDEPTELADITRAVEKIYNNRSHSIKQRRRDQSRVSPDH